MIHNRNRREDLLINMTPMIDVMIFLIVFFLAATNFAQIEREQDIQLPESRAQVGSLSKVIDSKVLINVKRDGSIHVGGRKIEEAELKALLEERRALLKDALKVEIRADKRTLHDDVVKVLVLVRGAGVLHPMIPTKEITFEP